MINIHPNSELVGNRRRVLMVAYHLDPGESMESRLGWYRAVQASESHHVTLFATSAAPQAIEEAQRNGQIDIELVPHTKWERFLMRFSYCFYLAYRLWHRRVYQRAQQIHSKRPFDLVHQVSFCGFREPGDCWRLPVPFVWGPLGGTQNVPAKFLGQLGWRGALSESCRSFVNNCQLYFYPRVKQAMRKASVVLAANREVQQDLQAAHRRKVARQLETGLDLASLPITRRYRAGEPLKILWAGRLESWKGLPLLLQALDQLPEQVEYQLRVVGGGRCERRWKQLSQRLGIADRVHWAGWPIYAEREDHYSWADAFVFTSLRDTSGTGLLESLEAGLPLIGLDHQGASDVMTPECALPIEVNSPKQVIADLRSAIVRLASDPKLLEQLSEGACARADHYAWARLSEQMSQIYQRALQIQQPVAVNKSDLKRELFADLPTSSISG